jgi:hypothetical protein
MDGPVKKDSEASPEGNTAARRPAEGVTVQEEKLVRLYMELTGCGESEARSTYMHMESAENAGAGGGG